MSCDLVTFVYIMCSQFYCVYLMCHLFLFLLISVSCAEQQEEHPDGKSS